MRTIIHPAAGRIVVKEIRGSDVTASGIILVNDIKREGHLGEVVAVCLGWTDQNGNVFESDFSPGDRVVFGKYVGTDLDIGRDKFIILMEKDIMCTLEEVEDGEAEG